MGVRGLETFIETYCPKNCCYDVSIEKLVEEYRTETGEEEPLILCVGTALCNVYNGLDWVCGGQFREYHARIKRFLDAFKSLNCQIVFFHGGTHPGFSRRNHFVANRTETLQRTFKIFDELSKGVETQKLPKYFFTNLADSDLYQRLEVQFGCEVHNMMNDSEIMQYARENKCFAVFGQDSDLLIAETGKYYLSAKHFKLDGLTTKAYDRQNLAKHLNLKPSQLPVLATLLGNDFVHFKALKRFHASLVEGNYNDFSKYFPAVADYVRQLPEGEALFEALPEVAERVFQDPEFSSLLSLSIQNYLSPIKISVPETECPEWNEVLQEAEIFYRGNIFGKSIMKVLIDRPYKKSVPPLEDFRRIVVDLPSSANILRPLRQRLYGILLIEKPKNVRPHFICEWMAEGPVIDYEPSQVKPISPSGQHPGLSALWGNNRSSEMRSIRWQLFTRAVSPNLNQTDLTSLPSHLVLPTSALFYLMERDIFKSWEIEALMVTATILPTMTLDELISLQADPVTPRAVHIASLFLESLNVMIELLSAVGYPFSRKKLFSHPCFDGKLFQENYRSISDGMEPEALCENKGSSSEHYQNMKQILSGKKVPQSQ